MAPKHTTNVWSKHSTFIATKQHAVCTAQHESIHSAKPKSVGSTKCGTVYTAYTPAKLCSQWVSKRIPVHFAQQKPQWRPERQSHCKPKQWSHRHAFRQTDNAALVSTHIISEQAAIWSTIDIPNGATRFCPKHTPDGVTQHSTVKYSDHPHLSAVSAALVNTVPAAH